MLYQDLHINNVKHLDEALLDSIASKSNVIYICKEKASFIFILPSFCTFFCLA
jgi:hypothetical protein